jgi:GNAT superfamily N-acetyltransferase
MIRPAGPDDVAVVLELIHALAEYERAADQVQATPEAIADALFGPQAVASCLLAVDDNGDGADPVAAPVGMALWFRTFSTWTGVPGIYLEDLFVRPHARGAGHGRALLAALADIAVERGYARLEWAVLDWNEPAQGFYRALGARPQSGWDVWRLTGDGLQALARLAR